MAMQALHRRRNFLAHKPRFEPCAIQKKGIHPARTRVGSVLRHKTTACFPAHPSMPAASRHKLHMPEPVASRHKLHKFVHALCSPCACCLKTHQAAQVHPCTLWSLYMLPQDTSCTSSTMHSACTSKVLAHTVRNHIIFKLPSTDTPP
jgi:hypothetical protein